MKLSGGLGLVINVLSESGIGALGLNPGVERVELAACLVNSSELFFTVNYETPFPYILQ